ncbi:MAG TPA: choice-of-anchor D domain-containing protein, partial [Acidimicrobiales bacterium]|nr:choice-of-anchor D domain-containing protein [Acidimicrobiales bacterium]
QTGVRSAVLQIDDNAKGGLTTIVFRGVGEYATTRLAGGGLVPVQPVGYRLAFGSTPVGTTLKATITITNTSSVVLRFGGDVLSGTNPSDFGFIPGNCAAGGDEMNPGARCTFIVTFDPSLDVFRTATLMIQDNTEDLGETISFSGSGTAASSGSG